jgi:hypothetical protein
MNHFGLFIGILGICALLAWAVTATIFAFKERNNYQTTFDLLRVTYAGLDNCFSYCGNPGSWVDAQKSKVNDLIISILQTQTKIICDNPETGFQALSQCATSALSQTYSYWSVVDPSNRASGTALILSAVNQCISSGQVTGCKIQN